MISKEVLWTLEFLKHKDIFKKEILSYKEIPPTIQISKKKTKEIIIDSQATKDINTYAKDFDRIWIVFSKDESTPEKIADQWESFKASCVWIVVVNTKTNDKWLLHPETHNKIVEEKNILQSLTALNSSE